MKKNGLAHIDSAVLIDSESEKTLVLRGWAIETDGTAADLQLKVNGKKVPFSRVVTNRPDIKKILKRELPSDDIGFELKAEINETPVVIKLLSSSGKTIFEQKASSISKSKINTEIGYEIEHCTNPFANGQTEPQAMQIQGYARGMDKSLVDISVEDEVGNVPPFHVDRLKRPDLVTFGVASQDQMESGFNLVFTAEPGTDYYVRFRSKYSDFRVPAKSTLEEQAVVKQEGTFVKVYRKVKSKGLKNSIRVVGSILKNNGLRTTVSFIKNKVSTTSGTSDPAYEIWFKRHQPGKEELAKQKEESNAFPYQPKISVVTAAYNTPLELLDDLFDSLKAQSYPNWEFCLADGSTGDKVKEHIATKYANDPQIKYVRLLENLGISGNTNEALKLADGDYVAFADHDDFLSPDAFYEVVKSLQETKHDFLYSDEDHFNDKEQTYCAPYFKPDYSLDMLDSNNYITHLAVISKDLLDRIGWLDSKYDGAQDYDLVLRATEQAESIHHIPKILYHWRMIEGSTSMGMSEKSYAVDAGKKALEDHFKRLGWKAEVLPMSTPLAGSYRTKFFMQEEPLVSIIIPSKDHSKDLKKCIDSILSKSTYKNLEIIVVENNSTESETFTYYDKLQKDHDNVHVVTYKTDGTFNYPKLNNFGVEHAKGDLLLFLNNDTELIDPGSIQEMASLIKVKGAGIVGAKLLYPDNSNQHVGIVIGKAQYASHCFGAIPESVPGYYGRTHIVSNYSAVTGACMMADRKVFDEIGGFDTDFAVACNDVDFCLQAVKNGHRVVFTPWSKWYHYESLSRGLDESGESFKRFKREVAHFNEKWPDSLAGIDPYHNPNFDVSIDPFYLNPFKD